MRNLPGDEARSKPRAPLRVGLVFVGIVVGLGVSLVVGSFVSALVQLSLVRKADEEGRQGWRLVPVLVANSEVAAGEVLVPQALAQSTVPAQLVTSLVLRPDSVRSVVGHALTAPLKKGDLMRSTFLAREPQEFTPADESLAKVCRSVLESRPTHAKPERTLEEIRERMLKGGAR